MADEAVEASQEAPKTFTQDEVNRIVAERAKRAVPSDYEDFKAKAAKFDELEAAQKSQEDRLRDEIAKLTAQNSEGEQKLARLSVLASSGIPAEHQDLVQGTTVEELEASAAKVKALLEEKAPPAGSARYVIPAEGGSPALALNGEGIENALKSALGIS